MAKKSHGGDGALLYEQQLELYGKQAHDEPWKHEHLVAMQCISFEQLLRQGMFLFDEVMRFDEEVRGLMLRGEFKHDRHDQNIRELVELWLKPCARIEATITCFEGLNYVVDGAAEFRKRHDEAVWILKPAGEAFDDPKMVECRDSAIDELRAGNAEPMQ